MKKLYLFLFALIISVSLNAEVFLDEPFDTWLPEGWSVIEGPGSVYYSHWWHRDESFATVFVTSDNQDEWLITPEITLPTAGDLRLSADMMGAPYRMITMDYGDFFVNISIDNGTTWETIWVEDDQEIVEASGVDWPWQHNEWFYPSISLNDYAGQTIKIGFRYVSPDGDADWWNLDNIMVKSLMQNEVALQEFNFPQYGLINDTYSFEGTFKNFGENEVTSFEAIYTVNSVESDPFIVDNISVPHNTTYSFTHDVPYTFENAELYDLSLVITKVNGEDDPVSNNNVLYHDISIATEYLARKPMFEVFTSSSCPACPGANEAVDATLANNVGNYSLVKYQVYWPGIGDPYYIVDDSIRSVYYNVGGVPDFYSNGIYDDGYSFNQSAFNAATAEGAMAEIDLDYYFTGINVTVNVNVTPTINILDAAVHIAIVEKTTYNNVGNNGETEFHNVLMKMLPGSYGTSFTLQPGETVSLSESANLIETFIEEFEDLQVVVWIQDNETRYVIQSESSDLTVGINDLDDQEKVSIYPNPVSNLLYIENAPGELCIYNHIGQLIYSFEDNESHKAINVSEFPNGIYIIEIKSPNGEVSRQKFIVK